MIAAAKVRTIERRARKMGMVVYLRVALTTNASQVVHWR